MLTIKLNKNTERQLNSLINEMQKTTGAEMWKVVRNTSRDIVRQALRATPKAERGIEKWSRIKLAERGFAKYADGSDIYLPARKIKKKYREAKSLKVRPGLARSGWSGCMVKLGIGRATKNGLRFSQVKQNVSKNRVGVLLANTIPFIEDLDNGNYKNGNPHHILERSIRAVNAKMEERLNKMAGIVKRKFEK